MSDTVTLPVSGMTCAACQARVQRQLEKTPGVEDAAVNLLLNSATIRFDPALVSPAGLVAAVRATGYESQLPTHAPDSAAEEEARDHEAKEEFSDLRRKAVVSLLAGLSVMAFMPPAPVQWVLATGVMLWAGRHFYTRAWQAFRHRVGVCVFGGGDRGTAVVPGRGGRTGRLL